MTCDTVFLGLMALTLHSEPGFETFTPGVYARWETGVIDPTGGVFNNSEGDLTGFAGGTWEDCTEEHPFFVTAGAAIGYECCDVVPIVVAGVKLGPARLGLLPIVEDRNGDVDVTGVGLNLSFEFNTGDWFR